MDSQVDGKKAACVVGSNAWIYGFKADNQKKISHLIELQELGDLKIFRADLTEEDSFDAPVLGCDLGFQVATPLNVASQDPENDMIKPATQGALNVLKACLKAKTVKRVILTSSSTAVSINTLSGSKLVIDEKDWSDVDFLISKKPPFWGYFVSKIVAEKAAWKFARENNIDLVIMIPTLTAGPSLTLDVPSCNRPCHKLAYRQ
ncbi:hypothetical protein SLA2020_472290 [Shorea laevis]